MNKNNCKGYATDSFKQDDSSMHKNSDTDLGIAPDQTGFVIMQSGRASLTDKQIPIIGRLQVYVRSGSQYATWRQFPGAIYYEVVVEQGKINVTPNYTRSISEDHSIHQKYSHMPSDQIVGTNFENNIFPKLSPLISRSLKIHFKLPNAPTATK